MSSKNAKRARRKIKNQPDEVVLTEKEFNYINREANKINRLAAGLTREAPRQFPCQKLTGKYAIIPANAKPEYNEEDGKWYLNGELIVSLAYKQRESFRISEELLKRAREKQANIKNLKPEVLGTEDGN